jgi:hypothetical protein
MQRANDQSKRPLCAVSLSTITPACVFVVLVIIIFFIARQREHGIRPKNRRG